MLSKMHVNPNAMKLDLVTSALRIYLTHVLQQTDEVLVACRFQMSISPEQHWQHAMNAAKELKDFIINCRQKLSHNVGFLCVVDSLQDALRESLHWARSSRNDRKECAPFDANAIRAKYLTYGFVASDSNEHELSSLWFSAAQNLQLRLELKFAASVTESLCQQAQQHVKASENVDTRALCSECPALNKKAVHHYRYAAALSALGRPHSHDYAAELYEKASDARGTVAEMQDSTYYYSKNPSTPGKLVLLESAAAAWQLAAEMAATQASNSGTLRDDAAIQTVVTAATKSAQHVHDVPALLKTVDQLKAAAAATKDEISASRDATMLPLWRDLAIKQEEAVVATESCFQSFIDGTIDADAARKSIATAINPSKVTASSIQQFQQCKTKEAYYKQMATESLQGSRPSPLASKCWTKAAVYIAEVAQLCVEDITAATGMSQELRGETQRIQRFRLSLADDCVFIAVHVLGSAVEYLDKARGAEAGEKSGRDPREAQMWRKAGECMVEKAKHVIKEMVIREETFEPKPSRYFKYCCCETQAVKQMDVNAQHFAKTAEYLYLSFKHRAALNADPLQNNARVAVLYAHTAELMMRKVGASDPVSLTKVVDQHLSLIHVLNESGTFSQEIIAARELICEFGEEGYAATDPALQQLWQKANGRLTCAVEENLSRERLLSASISAQLYALAARAENLSERLCFASAARVCEDASRVGEDADEEIYSGDDSTAEDPVYEYPTRLALYHHVLAEMVLVRGGVLFALPAEVTAFLQEVRQQSAEEGELKKYAEEHAECIMRRDHYKIKCSEVAESGPAVDAWKAVRREVDTMLSLLEQRAEDAFQYHQVRPVSKILFRSLFVKCCVAFAEAPPDSDSAAAWKRVVEVCEKSDPNKMRPGFPVNYSDVIKAAERAMALAQAQVAREAQVDA